MSDHPNRTQLFDEPIAFASSSADALVDVHAGDDDLARYLDITPGPVIQQGLALRASPSKKRFAVVPLGGRLIFWGGRAYSETDPLYFDPGPDPLILGVVGSDSCIEVELHRTPTGLERLIGWLLRPPPTLPPPARPETIKLPAAITMAAEAAIEAGGLGSLIATGLVMRFGAPPLEELLKGLDPTLPWVERCIAALDEDQAELAARLAATMAVQWARSFRRLDETLAPETDSWLAELWETLRLRDDLASALRVLRRIDRAAETEAIMAPVDAEAAAWLRALPVQLWLEDPHLSEVAREEGPFWARREWLAEP